VIGSIGSFAMIVSTSFAFAFWLNRRVTSVLLLKNRALKFRVGTYYYYSRKLLIHISGPTCSVVAMNCNVWSGSWRRLHQTARVTARLY
jgi:hypothetical protein